jgi:hypothetical protein
MGSLSRKYAVRIPLTPTLSPSDGEREKIAVSFECSLYSLYCELVASGAMCSPRPIGWGEG